MMFKMSSVSEVYAQVAENHRHKEIMDCLTVNGAVSVHKLAREVHASEATIRRDLTALEKMGYLRRTFGGAILTEMSKREIPYIMREQEHITEKDMAAQRAAEYISDGATIFMDASSTVYRLIPYLAKRKDITVITNGPKTSLTLGARGIENFCTGGMLLSDSVSYVGKSACDFIRRFNADIMLFSSRGVSQDGHICDSSVEESHIREAMLQHAKKKIYIFDSSKLGVSYRYNICSIRDVDMAICELPELPEHYKHIMHDLERSEQGQHLDTFRRIGG